MSEPPDPRPDGEGPEGGAPAPDDSRLTAALREHLALLEAGKRPNRQEFLARHAAIAGTLAAALDGLEFVHAAAPYLRPPGPALPAAGRPCRGAPTGWSARSAAAAWAWCTRRSSCRWAGASP